MCGGGHMAGDETTNWKTVRVIPAECGECLKRKRKRGSGNIKHTQVRRLMRLCEIQNCVRVLTHLFWDQTF